MEKRSWYGVIIPKELGRDGWTKFYSVGSISRDARVNAIAAGTSEVMRIVLYRWGLRARGA